MTKTKHQKVEKGSLHPRNRHIGQYNFTELVNACPELATCLTHNPKGELTIHFSDANSVLLLNKALLAYFYQINFWQIPEGYLCPPIPGRVDYLHYIADLLSEAFGGAIPKGAKIKGLDIGCGANCIYPILGTREYDWSFIGADIDTLAVKTAKLIISANNNINKKITIRQQKNSQSILLGIVKKGERFAFTMCNPPFHASMEKATEGSLLKQNNLKKRSKNQLKTVKSNNDVSLNFAGKIHELSCEGGEIAFVKRMIEESREVQSQVCWFTCLISKRENIAPLKKLLVQQNTKQVKVVEMSQGHKISRFIAWSYLDQQQQQDFFKLD